MVAESKKKSPDRDKNDDQVTEVSPSIKKKKRIRRKKKTFVTAARDDVVFDNNLRDYKSATYKMEDELFEAVRLGSMKIIPVLLNAGAAVRLAKDPEGNTLLHAAVLQDNLKIVECLLSAGIADVNVKNNESKTAMNVFLAHRHGRDPLTVSNMLRLLIFSGADVDSTSKRREGTSALHVAVVVGDYDLVRFMILRGVDVNFKDKSFHDWTALHYAAAFVYTELPAMFELLLSAGAKVNALSSGGSTPVHVLATEKPNLLSISLCATLEVFSKYGANFNAVDRDGRTPMDRAVANLNSRAVEALVLVAGVDVDCEFKSRYGPSNCSIGNIFHAACRNTDLLTVKFLLRNGADIDALDKYDSSPLKCVIDSVVLTRREEFETVKKIALINFILENNPDVNTVNSRGENILTSSGYELPDSFWQIILKHLAELQSIGSAISDSLLETISSKPEYKDFFDKCSQELKIKIETKNASDT